MDEDSDPIATFSTPRDDSYGSCVPYPIPKKTPRPPTTSKLTLARRLVDRPFDPFDDIGGDPDGVGGCDSDLAVGRNHLDRMLLFCLHGGTGIPRSLKLASICSDMKSTSLASRSCGPTKCGGSVSSRRWYRSVGREMTKCARR